MLLPVISFYGLSYVIDIYYQEDKAEYNFGATHVLLVTFRFWLQV
jgi:hypothetical protein